ncbi:hypothetical protein BHE74_00008641 [Ensete ventricosum]|nr:hypothetical protein GW17_00015547 [Ensete ventricosum]RWW82873.1 hypothetical protein BHE74_00008641 [Ensete ventricosum]RZR80792.1 hypothetical protein BHM03_00006881 [Ensete ventricosum]
MHLESQFLGTKFRACERVQLWRTDGPGRSPKLRVVSPSMSLSRVPEKPLGLYDPSYDKDSCGVGFIAELSGEYSRTTVTKDVGIQLPPPGQYAVGMFFLPTDDRRRKESKVVFAKVDANDD